MSTGADCHVREIAPGQWQYKLQRWPYGDNDEYDTFGPFGSFGAATEHLFREHANPGGYSIATLPEGEHVHRYVEGAVRAPSGVMVEVRVDSLGPEPTKEAVLEVLRTKVGVEHMRMWQAWGERPGIVCESCREEKK